MNFYNVQDINIISFLYTISLFYLSLTGNKQKNKAINIFSLIIILVSTNILLETLSVAIQTNLILQNKLLLEVINFIYYFFSIIIEMLMYILIFIYVKPDKKPTIVQTLIAVGPAVLNLICLFANPFTGWIYKISDQLKYSREDLFVLYFALVLYYATVGIILLITNFKRTQQKHTVSVLEFSILFLMIIMPIVGGMFQFLFYGTYLTWSMLGFVLSTSYYLLKTTLNVRDSLTNTWTRSGFEKHLDTVNIKNYSIALFDIDNLSKINNKFGYAEGDNLLINFSNMLKDVAPNECEIIRMGSNLFMIFYINFPTEKIEENMEKLQNIVDEYNMKNTKYTLEYTNAFKTFNPNVHKSLSYLVSNANDEIFAKKLAKRLETHIYEKVNE